MAYGWMQLLRLASLHEQKLPLSLAHMLPHGKRRHA